MGMIFGSRVTSGFILNTQTRYML
jgi:hypothetical protein